jgi:hypothetical protein
MREILCQGHADVPRRALRLNMQGAWAVNRRPDMRTRGATGTPGASLAAGAEQPAGRLASTGREAGTLFASVTEMRWLPPTAANTAKALVTIPPDSTE